MSLSAKIAAFEFEGDEVRLAVVKTGGRLPVVAELHACRAVYQEAGDRFDALVAAARNVVEKVKDMPSSAVLCASSLYSVARPLTLPFKGARRVAAAVSFELEPYLAFPIEEIVVDFNVVREIDGKTQLLAIGMRRSFLEEQVSVLDAAGVRVEGIGIDGAGLTSLWRAERRASAGLSAVLHLRAQASILVITFGKALAFLRHIPMTSAQFHGSPGSAAREVQNSLRSFASAWGEDFEIDELCVTGACLMDEERLLFEDGLPLRVVYEDLMAPLKGAGLAHKDDAPERVGAVVDSAEQSLAATDKSNRWAASVGVALGAAGGAFALDFCQGALAAAESMRGAKRHVAFSGSLAALLLVCYGAYCYLDYRRNMAEIDRIGGEIWQLYSESFPTSPNVVNGRPPHDLGGLLSHELMKTDLENGVGMESTYDAELFERPTLLDILKEISTKMPGSKVRVTNIKVLPGVQKDSGQRIQIAGEVTDVAAFDQVVEDLSKSELFKEVEDPRRRDEGGKATFTINVDI